MLSRRWMTHSIGVELELLEVSRKEIARITHEVVSGELECQDERGQRWRVTQPDGRMWRIIDDLSLNGPTSARGELISPVFYEAEIPVLEAIVEKLRDRGARVDSSCGM